MPITTSSFLSINAEFAASTASNAQLSLQDTAIAAQVYPTGGGRIFGPIDFSTIQSVSTTTVYDGAANFGWFAGGSTPTVVSTVDRIDFNNDTVAASSRGPLTAVTYTAGTSNANYSWYGGGNPGPVSNVNRVDYATDTAASSSRGKLTTSQYGIAAAGNANFGWWAGGSSGGTAVARMEYSNDTANATARGFLSAGSRSQLAATGNSNYGWWAGGLPGPTVSSTVDRIDYANDSPTVASARATLPMPRGMFSAAGNSNYGWFAGGQASPTILLSFVHRIDFANDSPTSASPRGPLSSARVNAGSAGNANYGWWTGGTTPTITSLVDRIDYNNDTVSATVRGTLSGVRFGTAGTSNYVKSEKGVILAAKIPFTEVWSVNTFTNQGNWLGVPGTYGWYGGGFPGTPTMTTQIDRIDFANDSPTAATTRGSLTQARTQMGAGTNGTYGWWAGGYGPATTTQSTVNRLDFSNDTAASVARGSLSVTKKGNPVGLPNSDYLWFAGGPNPITSIERLDYSNDASTLSVRGNLLTGYSGSAGSSNQFYGWVVGGSTAGSPPPVFSRVERIDFANDSPTSASLRGPLTVAKQAMGAGGNSNYGWIAGGDTGGPNTSVVERIDYSNESPTAASPRSPLAAANAQGRLTTNVNYGWYGGGGNPGSSAVSRIDFSNDTVTASPRGPLTATMNHEIGAATSNYVKARSQPAGTTTATTYSPASIVPTPATPYAASPGTFGYFAGGSGTTVDRIDFSNDSPTSASPRSILPVSAGANAGTANANYGWISGGAASNASIYRIDFGSDTTIASTRGSLLSGSQDLAAAGNANYGWFAGGGGVTSRVERINYASDLVSASPRGPLSIARQSFAAAANGFYGWFTGGYTPGNTSVVDRLDFSNDSPTSATARAALPITNRDMAAFGNENFGWVAGGTPVISTVYRIDYANDTNAATTRGPLSRTRSNMKGAGNANFGWIGGNSPADNTIDRIDYANDSPTSASPRGNLSASRSSFAAVSNYVKAGVIPAIVGTVSIYTTATTTPIVVNGNYGWFGGGQLNPSLGNKLSSVDRIDFSNDTITADIRGKLQVSRRQLAGTSNANYGWIGGGIDNTPISSSWVDRLDFSNDNLTAGNRSPLSAASYSMAAAGNNSYGWFGGGIVAPAVIISTVTRIDYSNDGTTPITRGPLSVSVYSNAAAANNNYGWWAGGYAPAAVSTVSRVDFNNDSPTVGTTRGPLSLTRTQISATSNANYAWFAGGQPSPYSTVDRIDFSNDSPTAASPRGPLSQTLYGGAAAGNANYGWFGGGYNPGSLSLVNRIDYSNDTATASIRGNISTRSFPTAVSNTAKDNLTFSAITGNIGTYGWWAGGNASVPGPDLSTVDRIDFSNDSPSAASPRGGLTLPRWAAASTGNANYGWHGGGQPQNGNVERTDFANDTSANSPRGSLPNGHYQHAAVGNANYAWHVGGAPIVTGLTSVDRINYSNDTASASTRSQVAGISALAATGTANYGWFGGGRAAPAFNNTSVVNRIDYSNDSPSSASPRGPLSLDRYYLAGMGNNNYGWFAGGYAPIRSTVDRIDYSNDSNAAVTRGPLTAALTKVTAAGNSNYGWLGGGDSNGFYTSTSVVYRIDYSNDSSTSQQRGPKSLARFWDSASSNYVQSRTEILASSPVNWTGGTWIRGGLSIA